MKNESKPNSIIIPPGVKAGNTFNHAGRELVVIKSPETDELIAMEMIHSINTTEIDPHPLNRKWFSVEGMKDLVDSIRAVGQTTPGIARRKPDGRLEQIAGERRWKACIELGIPVQVVIREMSDSEAVEVLLIENAKREGLRPVDEAEIYDAMLKLQDEQGKKLFSLERIAERVHGEASRANVMRVSRMHKLLQLPANAAQALNDGDEKMSLVKAFLVARVADPKDREKAAEDVMKPQQWSGKIMTVKEADEHIRQNFQVSLKGWGDHMNRRDLLTPAQEVELGFTGNKGEPNDGSCAKCPWLAKNNPAYADSMSSSGGKKDAAGETGIEPNTCTRARCHAMKLENLWQKEGAEFQLKHSKAQRVLTLVESKGNEFVVLKSKPSGQDTGKWDDKPTWEKLIKGQDVPVLVGRSYEGVAVLMVHKKTALAAARVTHPEIFAKQEINTADMSPEEKKAHAEKEKKKREKEALEAKIADDVKRESMVAMHDLIAKKGLGIDGRKVLAQAIGRSMNITGAIETLTGEELKGSDEKALDKHLAGKTQHEIDAFIALLSIWEDVQYSQIKNADDFQLLCKALGVDLKDIAQKVKDRHVAAAKVKADAEKAAQEAKDRKPSKNSSDPTDVSTDKEVSKTKAADKIAKGNGVTDAQRAFYRGNPKCNVTDLQKKFNLPRAAAIDIFDALVDEKFDAKAPTLGVGALGKGPARFGVSGNAKDFAKAAAKKATAPAAVKVEAELLAGATVAKPAGAGVAVNKKGKPELWTAPDIELGAVLLMNEAETITDLIGSKPDRKKDEQQYKTWNSVRMKLLRKAGLAA